MARIITKIPATSLKLILSFRNIAPKIAAKTGEVEEG